jgi:transposase
MDMWKPFRVSTQRHAPKAVIMFDKFHIVKHLGDALDAWRMIQRRAAELGLRAKIGCHTFRATGITAYLEAGGTLENAQAMAAHESPRTTKLYDRTGDEITLDEVERITI